MKRPRFLVLNGRLPAQLAAPILPSLDLFDDGALGLADADGILVYATGPPPPALRHLRETGVTLPVFGIAPAPVDVTDRILWIRAGADDLLSAFRAADVIQARLRNDDPRIGALGETAADPGRTGDRVDRWLLACHLYFQARERIIDALDEGGRVRFLDCVFLRDQVLRAGDTDSAPDAFGQRRGGDREPLGWPVHILSARACAGELLNVGADGACLGVGKAPDPGDRMEIGVAGASVEATIRMQVRWQRRVARDRWQIGAFAIDCTLLRGG